MLKLSLYRLDNGELQLQSELARPIEAVEMLNEAIGLVVRSIKHTIQSDLGFGLSTATGGFVPFDEQLEGEYLASVPAFEPLTKGN